MRLPALAVASVLVSAPRAAADVDFARDVRPVLTEYCFACHGPDEKGRKADLRLDTKDGLTAAAKEVLARVTAADPAERMPPVKGGKKLAPAQVAALNGIRLYGPPPDAARTSTISFTRKGHNSEAIARALAEKGVFVSNGDFYAETVVKKLGLGEDGLVGVGCACYTTEDEIDRVIAGVRELG